jgi:CBS domain containing-hemolysin-like protein
MIHSPFATSLFIWVSIAFCIIQSAIFSGLNLAIFSVSKLRLEVEAAGGNRDAISLLGLRKDSNLTLSAVLWGNVTINVLLTCRIPSSPALERSPFRHSSSRSSVRLFRKLIFRDMPSAWRHGSHLC